MPVEPSRRPVRDGGRVGGCCSTGFTRGYRHALPPGTCGAADARFSLAGGSCFPTHSAMKPAEWMGHPLGLFSGEAALLRALRRSGSLHAGPSGTAVLSPGVVPRVSPVAIVTRSLREGTCAAAGARFSLAGTCGAADARISLRGGSWASDPASRPRPAHYRSVAAQHFAVMWVTRNLWKNPHDQFTLTQRSRISQQRATVHP